jgi:hypothetical protein
MNLKRDISLKVSGNDSSLGAKSNKVWLVALYPQRLPVSQAITIDYGAMLYKCALVILAGFLVGFVPALHATGARMQEILRTDSRTATSSRRAVTARSVLVISQLALSVILLVGALLLIQKNLSLFLWRCR